MFVVDLCLTFTLCLFSPEQVSSPKHLHGDTQPFCPPQGLHFSPLTVFLHVLPFSFQSLLASLAFSHSSEMLSTRQWKRCLNNPPHRATSLLFQGTARGTAVPPGPAPSLTAGPSACSINSSRRSRPNRCRDLCRAAREGDPRPTKRRNVKKRGENQLKWDENS